MSQAAMCLIDNCDRIGVPLNMVVMLLVSDRQINMEDKSTSVVWVLNDDGTSIMQLWHKKDDSISTYYFNTQGQLV